MPEPTPTTDTKGKKPNKTVIILGAAGVAILVYFFWKSKKAKEEAQVPYTSQAFIPVTGENVAGAGASAPFGGSGLGGGVSGVESSGALAQAQEANNRFIEEILKSEQESRREENRLRFEQGQVPPQPIAVTITGGGAPGSGQIGSGAGSGGGGHGATTTTKPSSPVASFKTIKCPNGCTGHEYPHGRSGKGSREVECQKGEARRGNCNW